MEDVHYDAGQYGFTVCAGKGVVSRSNINFMFVKLLTTVVSKLANY